MDKQALRDRLTGLDQDNLRTLRSIINGKLSKRTLTPEQSRQMVATREKKRKEIAVFVAGKRVCVDLTSWGETNTIKLAE